MIRVYKKSRFDVYKMKGGICRGRDKRIAKQIQSAFYGWPQLIEVTLINNNEVVDVYIDGIYRNKNSRTAGFTELGYLCDKMELDMAEALYYGKYNEHKLRKLAEEHGTLTIRENEENSTYSRS